jgi:hypothetical protein
MLLSIFDVPTLQEEEEEEKKEEEEEKEEKEEKKEDITLNNLHGDLLHVKMDMTPPQRHTARIRQRNEAITAIPDIPIVPFTDNIAIGEWVAHESVHNVLNSNTGIRNLLPWNLRNHSSNQPVDGAYVKLFKHRVVNHNGGQNGSCSPMYHQFKYIGSKKKYKINQWLSDGQIWKIYQADDYFLRAWAMYCSSHVISHSKRRIGRAYDWYASHYNASEKETRILPDVPEVYQQNHQFQVIVQERNWIVPTVDTNLNEYVTDAKEFIEQHINNTPRQAINRLQRERIVQGVCHTTRTHDPIVRHRRSILYCFLAACINTPNYNNRPCLMASFFTAENIKQYIQFLHTAASRNEVVNAATMRKVVDCLLRIARRLIGWTSTRNNISKNAVDAYCTSLDLCIEELKSWRTEYQDNEKVWLSITKEMTILQTANVWLDRNELKKLVTILDDRLNMYCTWWYYLEKQKEVQTAMFNHLGWFLEIGQVLSIKFFIQGLGPRPSSLLEILTTRIYFEFKGYYESEEDELVPEFTTIVRFPGTDKSRDTTSNRHIGFGTHLTNYMALYLNEIHPCIETMLDIEDNPIIFRETYGAPLKVDTFIRIIQRMVGFIYNKYCTSRLLRYIIGASLFNEYRNNPDQLSELFYLQNHSANTARIYYTVSSNNREFQAKNNHKILNNWLKVNEEEEEEEEKEKEEKEEKKEKSEKKDDKEDNYEPSLKRRRKMIIWSPESSDDE